MCILETARIYCNSSVFALLSVGGLEFATGRIVEELGDTDDVGICVAACVSIGYDSEGEEASTVRTTAHKTYNTKDGY